MADSGNEVRIVRAAAATSIAAVTIFSVSDSRIARRRSNSSSESRLFDGSGTRCRLTVPSNSSNPRSFARACSCQRESVAGSSGAGLRGTADRSGLLPQRSHGLQQFKPLADAPGFMFELQIGCLRRAAFQHIGFVPVGRAVDVHHVVIRGAVQPVIVVVVLFVFFLVVLFVIFVLFVVEFQIVERPLNAGAEQVELGHLPVVLSIGFEQFEESHDERRSLFGRGVRHVIGVRRAQTWANQRFARA